MSIRFPPVADIKLQLSHAKSCYERIKKRHDELLANASQYSPLLIEQIELKCLELRHRVHTLQSDLASIQGHRRIVYLRSQISSSTPEKAKLLEDEIQELKELLHRLD
jgi:hypothetical protein